MPGADPAVCPSHIRQASWRRMASSEKAAKAARANEGAKPLGEAVRVYGNVGIFTRSNLAFIWLALILAIWFLNPIKALPLPGEVLRAIVRMWRNNQPGQGLAYNVYVTLK